MNTYKRLNIISIKKADLTSIIKSLRILTGKKYRQIKLQRLEKVRIWAFGLLVH